MARNFWTPPKGIGQFTNPFAVQPRKQSGIGGMMTPAAPQAMGGPQATANPATQAISAPSAAGMNAQDIMANFGGTRDPNGNVNLPNIVDTRGTGRYWTGDRYETVRSAPGGQGMDVSIEGGFPGFTVAPTPPRPAPQPQQPPVPQPVPPSHVPSPQPAQPPTVAVGEPYRSQYLYDVRTGQGSYMPNPYRRT